jgi:hypothetical protein
MEKPVGMGEIAFEEVGEKAVCFWFSGFFSSKGEK